MAVLSDHELWSLLASGRLRIEPPPDADAVSPSAIDLTLDSRFTRLPNPATAIEMSIDTRDSAKVMEALATLGTEEIVSDGQTFTLKSGEFALAWTREVIGLPNFLCARVEGRSTLARLGLSVHQTAPTVHATFSNKLQLELHNSGPYALKLYPGSRICQLIVETMSSPATSILRSIHQSRA
jgi:dCTP deaminase